MDYIYIGKIVNTHGIKGEVRILSDIEYKESIFKQGTHLYIGTTKKLETIATYRFHKIYDMVTFEGIQDINAVLPYKSEAVYINREEIHFPGILKTDLIGMEVYSNGFKGKVTSILKSKAHDILVIENNEKRYLVPYVDSFIEKIDIKNHILNIKEMKGLFDEN